MNMFEWVNSWERAWLFWMGMMSIVFFSIWVGTALQDAVENFWVPLLEVQLM
jgi:hypothetical protein